MYDELVKVHKLLAVYFCRFQLAPQHLLPPIRALSVEITFHACLSTCTKEYDIEYEFKQLQSFLIEQFKNKYLETPGNYQSFSGETIQLLYVEFFDDR